MFSEFLVNTWVVATLVAVVAGVVGFFVVVRGSTFVAHAVPLSAFAGAAGASLVGLSTLAGLGTFSLASVLGIGLLGRRGRHDVATALAVTLMLGLGALFLSFSSQYAPAVYSLLFGQLLGITSGEVVVTLILCLATLATTAYIYRPLLMSSVVPEIAESRGLRAYRMEMLFLALVALVTTMTVPIVGTLLMFTLMVGPTAAARCVTTKPLNTMAVATFLALITVWVSIAASYETNWPIGFFVGALSAFWYIAMKAGTHGYRDHAGR